MEGGGLAANPISCIRACRTRKGRLATNFLAGPANEAGLTLTRVAPTGQTTCASAEEGSGKKPPRREALGRVSGAVRD